MKLEQVVSVLERIAPTRWAESWDNVGLLTGDPNQEITHALLTIDYTRQVADEARREGSNLILAYHPPIFKPVKRLESDGLIYDAIRRGVAIYSPHTAWDVAHGGTNDVLADAIGLAERRPLRRSPTPAANVKLVTFVPSRAVDAVADALFAAGAGRIGNYTHCSFRTPGTGTFFGQEGTQPTVGQAGRLESADEIRLETLVPLHRLTQVVEALRTVHPYEEPAFDLLTLAPEPASFGLGRIGNMPPVSRAEIIQRIKTNLGLSQVLVAGPLEGSITRAACCAGACGELLDEAMAQKAELYLTGEMRHHDALKAAQAGMTVVCTLHSNSERATLKRLAARLHSEIPEVSFHVSRLDCDPFSMR